MAVSLSTEESTDESSSEPTEESSDESTSETAKPEPPTYINGLTLGSYTITYTVSDTKGSKGTATITLVLEDTVTEETSTETEETSSEVEEQSDNQ